MPGRGDGHGEQDPKMGTSAARPKAKPDRMVEAADSCASAKTDVETGL